MEQRDEDIALTENLGVVTSSRGLVETSVSPSTSRVRRASQFLATISGPGLGGSKWELCRGGKMY